MSVRKIRGRWWVDLRHRLRRYRMKSPLDTRAGAEQYEATLRAALARGEDIAARPAPPARETTLAEFAAEWFETYVKVNNKPSSQRAKRFYLDGHLLPAFGARPLSSIRTEDVERYKAQKSASGLAPKTVNEHLGTLGLILRTAREWGVAAAEPKLRPMRVPPSTPRFLSAEEADRLVAAAEAPWRAMVAVALDTGMRLGEICGLAWADVDLAAAQLVVRRNMVRGEIGSPKNNRVRTIPLSDRAAGALAGAPRAFDLVFCRADGSPHQYSSAGWALARACRRAGIPELGWHALRHTFASELIARGASLRAVQELLGHASVAMTERYAHVAPRGLREAVSLLSRAAGGHAGPEARVPAGGTCSLRPPVLAPAKPKNAPLGDALAFGAWSQN